MPLLPLYAFMARTVKTFYIVCVTTLSEHLNEIGTKCEVPAMIITHSLSYKFSTKCFEAFEFFISYNGTLKLFHQ